MQTSFGSIFAKTVPIALLSAFVIAALWWPFGFSLGGLIEEWDILYLFTQHGLFFIADASSPLAAHRTRPLTILPHAIAYAFDNNSFLFWHIIQIISLFVKSICGGIVGLYLTRDRTLAAALGLLTLLYPADTMQLSLRSIHINAAVALALLATVLMLAAVHSRPRSRRLSLALAASVFYCTATLMYEVVLQLIMLPVLIVFARHGLAETLRTMRAKWDALALWFASFAVCLIHFAWAMKQGPSYQSEVISGADTVALTSIVLGNAEKLVTSGLYRAFYEGWIDAVRIILDDLNDFSYLALVTGMVFAVLLADLRRRADGDRDTQTIWLAARICIAGLVAFLLGYLPFMASAAYLATTQRTFLAATPGATLVMLSFLMMVAARFGCRSAAAAAAGLIGLCFVSQLYQFDKYNRIYAEITKPILAQLGPASAQAGHKKTLVVDNKTGRLNGVWDTGISLQPALAYINNGANTVVCDGYTGKTLPFLLGSSRKIKRCEDANGIVSVVADGQPSTSFPGAVRVQLSAEGKISYPESDGRMPVKATPPRLAKLLERSWWTVDDSLFRQNKPDSFRCEFESTWGFAQPCRTFGFQEGIAKRAGFKTASYAWIVAPRAGLIFDLEPATAQYRLSINVHRSLSPSRNVGVTLNGRLLEPRWDGEKRLTADVPADALRRGTNILEIQAEPEATLGLSLGVERVLVEPL